MLYSDSKNRPQNKSRKILKWSSIVLGTLAIMAGLPLFGAWLYHPKAIYSPIRFEGNDEAKLLQKIPFAPEKVTITTSDGVKLRGYWFKDRQESKDTKSPTLLFLRGSDFDIEGTFSTIQKWQSSFSLNALVLSYRGYGSSEGSPSMTGIQADAQAALGYLLKHPTVDPANIILYGHSLGGAVALHLAAANLDKFKVVIIENTFKSVKSLASHRYPKLSWIMFVITQVWDNEDQLESIAKLASKEGQSVPNMLFISGAKDRNIPPEHMDRLWNLAQKVKKASPNIYLQRLNMSECYHECYDLSGYFEGIKEFLQVSSKVKSL